MSIATSTVSAVIDPESTLEFTVTRVENGEYAVIVNNDYAVIGTVYRNAEEYWKAKRAVGPQDWIGAVESYRYSTKKEAVESLERAFKRWFRNAHPTKQMVEDKIKFEYDWASREIKGRSEEVDAHVRLLINRLREMATDMENELTWPDMNRERMVTSAQHTVLWGLANMGLDRMTDTLAKFKNAEARFVQAKAEFDKFEGAE